MTLREFIFLILGALAGAFLVILIDGEEVDPDTIIISASCNDTGRYDEKNIPGYTIIDTFHRNDLRNIFYERFRVSSTAEDPETGTLTDQTTMTTPEQVTVPASSRPFRYGFISKKALDNIFSNNLNANGVECYIGMEGEDIKLMISGGRCTEVNGPEIPSGSDATVLITSYCPTMCR